MYMESNYSNRLWKNLNKKIKPLLKKEVFTYIKYTYTFK